MQFRRSSQRIYGGEERLRLFKNVMESFGVTIEKAMEALKIPQSQRSTYAELVGKKTR